MKKFSLCIGAVMVLFFVVGAYTAQAQSYPALEQLNGTWLKMAGTAKGVTYTEQYVNADAVGKFSYSFKDQYACIAHDPSYHTADLCVYDKTGKEIGYAVLYFHGGTTEQWTGDLYYYLGVGTYDYATDGTNLYAYSMVSAKIKDGAGKGSIKGVGGYGYARSMGTATDYSDMGVKINAKIAAADKLPFTAPECSCVMPTE